MIKNCGWVPFFGAKCKRIYELSDDLEKRDEKLSLIAKDAFYSEHTILQYPSPDPFSYIFTLAKRNTKNQKADTFTKAKNAIDLDEEVPTDFVFPTPTPNTPSLFSENNA